MKEIKPALTAPATWRVTEMVEVTTLPTPVVRKSHRVLARPSQSMDRVSRRAVISG